MQNLNLKDFDVYICLLIYLYIAIYNINFFSFYLMRTLKVELLLILTFLNSFFPCLYLQTRFSTCEWPECMEAAFKVIRTRGGPWKFDDFNQSPQSDNDRHRISIGALLSTQTPHRFVRDASEAGDRKLHTVCSPARPALVITRPSLVSRFLLNFIIQSYFYLYSAIALNN